MTERQQQLVQNVEKHRQMILDAERWLWAHPQTGYTEWEAHNYLVEKYEALGYSLTLAGNIPGFYTEVDTGRPGPKLAIFGELDALDIANHPESVNGMAHCCGHNGQSAALLGIAAALKEPGALDGLCGTIRLVAVPAEEMIQLAFREDLRKKGVIGHRRKGRHSGRHGAVAERIQPVKEWGAESENEDYVNPDTASTQDSESVQETSSEASDA